MTDLAAEDPEEPDMDLVVPFVVVQSAGGPYADEAFVAGVQYGYARRMMQTSLGHEVAVPPALVPQMELLAMEFDWEVTTDPVDDDYTWVHLKSRRPPVFGEEVEAS